MPNKRVEFAIQQMRFFQGQEAIYREAASRRLKDATEEIYLAYKSTNRTVFEPLQDAAKRRALKDSLRHEFIDEQQFAQSLAHYFSGIATTEMMYEVYLEDQLDE